MRRHGTFGVAAALAAGLLAVPKPASAASACWKQGVDIVVDESVDQALPQGFSATAQAVGAWQSVAAVPRIKVLRGTAGPVGYDPAGPNQNTVRYAAAGAPEAQGAVAVTIVTYDRSTNSLLDADIILNGEHAFGDVGAEGAAANRDAYDVQNVITHELGHLLGLGEDYEHEHATMFAYTRPRETCKRNPSVDDRIAIRALYFSAEDEPEAGCGGATVTGRSPTNHAWIGALALVVGAAGRLRRRRALSLGLGLGALALAGPAVGLTSDALAPVDVTTLASAEAIVTGVESSWQGGLIVSRLTLTESRCSGAAAECTELAQPKLVYGGQVGDIVQIVGHAPTPAEGARVALSMDEGRDGRFVAVRVIAGH